MKLAPLDPFSKAAPGFNKEIAKKVYDAIMDCPDDESAAVMTRCIVFEAMRRDVAAHEPFLIKHYQEQIQKRAELLRKGIAKQYLAKQLKGEDVGDLIKASAYLTALSKDYTAAERRRNVMSQRRGPKGQWVREHTKLQYDSKQAVDPRIFNRLYGVNMPLKHGDGTEMKDVHLRNWQLAYQQIQDEVGPYAKHPGATVHIHYPRDIVQVKPNEVAGSIRTKQRPLGVSVSVDEPYSLPAGAPDFFQMGSAIGRPDMGARVAGTVSTQQEWSNSALNPSALRRYREIREQGPREDYVNQPGAQLFHRMSTGSDLLQATLGENASPKTKAALEAANWVGNFGPEAQMVIGPTAQRTAYRYRGVERKPDPELKRQFLRVARDNPNASLEERVAAVTEPLRDERGKEHLGPVVQYFKNRLPKANLNTLHTASGTIPPSEGILLDKKGNIVTQAIGYGDDWYLPFNLKNVSRMRGGSYIRTRTFGGPTTEDIYTALISGANQLTVISWNGIYTVEFDKSFKGGRRYNDKAARMVGRYGHLLDAVDSGRVTLDAMDPSRRQEIQELAQRNVRDPDNEEQIRTEVLRLTNAERLHPQLSENAKAELRAEIIADEARKIKTRSGEETSPESLKRLLAIGVARSQLDPATPPDSPMLRQKAEQVYSGMTDESVITASPELTERYQKAVDQRVGEIRRELSPLTLNGQGYKLALDALHEQFPYYIHKPVYRQWTDPANRKDTGYVKPRHNRPEAALAGYYDTDVTGYGKIHAHSQFYLKPKYPKDHVRVGQEKKDEQAEQAAQSTASGSAPAGSRSAVGADGNPDTVAAAGSNAVAAQGADMAMAKHIRDLAKNGIFKEGAEGGLGGKKAADSAFLRDPKADGGMGAIGEIGSKSDSDLQDMQDTAPEAFRQKVVAALQQIDDKNLFDVNESIRGAFRRRGARQEAKEVPNDLMELLLHPNSEYNLGAGFIESRNHSRADLIARQAADQDILMAQKAGLPDITDENFKEASDQQVQRLVELSQKFVAHPVHYDEAQKRDAGREALGVIKAKHLHRRLTELPAEATPAADDEGVVETIDEVAIPASALAAVFRNMQQGRAAVEPAPPKAIENPNEEDWLSVLSPAERKRLREKLDE